MSTSPRTAISFSAVPLWLLFALALPFVAIALHRFLPRSVANSVFFAPQYLFSLRQLVRPVDGGFAPMLTEQGAATFCVLLWLATTLAFGYFARRLSGRTQLVLAPLAVLVAAGVLHLTAAALGYSLQLDGP
jgi:hypothetical protein